MMIPLLGFAALAVDMGMLYTVRVELQRAADAAALAGATALASDSMLARDDATILADVYSRAVEIAAMNKVLRTSPHLEMADIELGIVSDPADLRSPFILSNPAEANAVRVTLRRTDNSTDGPVPLFFAAVLGQNTANVIGTATAVLDDRFTGYRLTWRDRLIPFTILDSLYEDQLVNGCDDYSYSDETVRRISDNIPEIWLFPDKQKETDVEIWGGGNFGTLAVGIPSNSVSLIEGQICSGLSPEEMMAEIGTPDICFFDDNENPLTYDIDGSPGLNAGLRDALESRIGEIVGFFTHESLVLNGSNCVYTITGIRFGRVMAVNLKGNPKALVIQPVAHAGSDVITDPEVPSTDKLVANLHLVQ